MNHDAAFPFKKMFYCYSFNLWGRDGGEEIADFMCFNVVVFLL